jgi:pyruvate,water dikinase
MSIIKMVGKERGGKFIRWFSELSNKDIAIAGGKGASLAEMYNSKFPIPPGFIITAQAYSYFIENSSLLEKIMEKLKIDMEDTETLERVSREIREMISNSEMPLEMESEIIDAYELLDVNKAALVGATQTALAILNRSKEPPFVAVRSSATTEDLAEASFAGQQESFINVKGKSELIRKVKECFASLFTARAVYYREKKGFGQEKAELAVVVQKMVDADKSGVIFSRNPITMEDTIMIEAVWGLGEGIVSGRIKPDSYIIDGNVEDFKILETNISEKKVAITRSSAGENQIVKLTPERAKQQVLSTYEIKILAIYSKQLEEHYKKPQDIEFAIAGRDIYIVQSRPITTLAKEGKAEKEVLGEVLLSGLGASPGIGSGTVKVVYSIDDLKKIKKGDVLVTEMTNPDMVVTMQRAAAIVTDEGGVTSHAAIVSREMGIPAVVGTGKATKKLKDGDVITVDGYRGKVLGGVGETKVSEVNPVVKTKTKIKVMVDLPDFAERAAQSGAKEVGLTRIEGIIAESGKHPLYFVKNKAMNDYVELIYNGIKKIAEPFEGVWIRSSDIRSDEYRNLEGAPKQVEGNPMLGNHGIRFGLKNREILKAEIKAIVRVAKEFPNKKIGLMMPQVISVDELKETKKIASEVGYPENFVIGIMIETPAAVQIINDLCVEGISFISFGTNDLTQYMLAIDRNNSEVQYIYDEMNPAVLSALSYVIRRCRRYGIETSICGQAGSKEEMVRFLVSEGIDSISVNADAAERISKLVQELEGVKKAEKIEEKSKEEVKEETKTEEIKEELEEVKEEPKEERLEQSEKVEEGSVPVPQEEPAENEKEEGEDEYIPGEKKKDADVPQLNDAIPIDSSLFEENEKEEFDLHKELSKS